jgi:hypothetical protein
MPPPQPTSIYHISHLSNLSGILAAGGLRCNRTLSQQGVGYTNIAHGNIQSRRANKVVTCSAGGTLRDYVPFYFGSRSPMLFAIKCGNVAGYTQGQGPVLHLVPTVQAVAAAGLPFAFTNGHGIMGLTDFFDNLADLDEVDWPLMTAKWWNDTQEDGDRSRRRQAEFLVHQFFPWNLVQEIGLSNNKVKATVEAAITGQGHQPPVHARPDWYY